MNIELLAPHPNAIKWALATVCCGVADCPSKGRQRSTSCDCSRDPEALTAQSLLTLASRIEQQRIAADIAYNAMKNSGELQRMEADRALSEQIKWEAV